MDAALYAILFPTGPHIRDLYGKGLSLLTMSDQIHAWPGDMGGFKLGLNYAADFPAQRVAAALGYQQILRVLGERVAEAGAMNIFAVFERPDSGRSLSSLLPGCSVHVRPLVFGLAHSSLPLRSQNSTW